jgi:predicted nucleic acid-binding protein
VVFADSSGFIAAFDARDARHQKAARAWRKIVKARERLVTTRLVVAETVTFFRRRGGWAVSRQVGETILASDSIEVVALDRSQFDGAWREFVRNPDPKLSLCDAASFIVMRDLGITRALTFDNHFSQAGFELATD